MTPEQREAWLVKRRQGIGASDIAKIAGLVPKSFGGPLDVYLDKLQLHSQKDNQAMWLGRIFEDAVAKAYEHQTGRQTFSYEYPDNIITHPQYPWLFSTPDRGVIISSGDKMINLGLSLSRLCKRWLECKHSGDRIGWGRSGSDQIPPGYFAQVQWQLLSAQHLGVEQVDVAVCLPGSDFRVYEIRPVKEIQILLFALGSEMMSRIFNREPPALDFSDPRTSELINLLQRPTAKKTISLPDECDLLADGYKDLGERISELEKARDLFKAGIVLSMEESEEGTCPSGRVITRKADKKGSIRLNVGTRPESEGDE